MLNAELRVKTLRYAVVENLRKPPLGLEAVSAQRLFSLGSLSLSPALSRFLEILHLFKNVFNCVLGGRDPVSFAFVQVVREHFERSRELLLEQCLRDLANAPARDRVFESRPVRCERVSRRREVAARPLEGTYGACAGVDTLSGNLQRVESDVENDPSRRFRPSDPSLF